MDLEQARFLFHCYVSLFQQLSETESSEGYQILKAQQSSILAQLGENGFQIKYSSRIERRSNSREIPAEITLILLRDGAEAAKDVIRADLAKTWNYRHKEARAIALFQEYLVRTTETAKDQSLLVRIQAIDAELNRLGFFIKPVRHEGFGFAEKKTEEEAPGIRIALLRREDEFPVAYGKMVVFSKKEDAKTGEEASGAPKNIDRALQIFLRFENLMRRAIEEGIDSTKDNAALEEARDTHLEGLDELGWKVNSEFVCDLETIVPGQNVPVTFSFSLCIKGQPSYTPARVAMITTTFNYDEFVKLVRGIMQDHQRPHPSKVKLLLSSEENRKFLKSLGLDEKENK